jgi:hypothetical protein
LRAALDWAFSSTGDESLGVALTTAAVPLWLRLSLLAECGRRARQSLAALKAMKMPDQREEMRLHAALGASLTDASEMAEAFARVLDNAEILDDTEYRLRALRGLYFHGVWTNQFRAALSLAQKFHNLAASQSNHSDQVAGERMLGTVKYTLGDLDGARRHLDLALTPYPTTDSGQATARVHDVIRFQNDGTVEARVFLAGVLWLQGFPDQGMRMAESGLAEARAINHASSQCFALALGSCPLSLWTGDIDAAAHYTRLLIDLSTGYGLAHWAHYGAMYRKVITLKGGNVGSTEGLYQYEAHLQSRTAWTEFIDALVRAGQHAQGLAVLDKVVASVPDPGNFAAEWLRLRGELLLSQTTPTAARPSEELFRQALDIAHQQGALSWELRAATSLARLLHAQSRQGEAVNCLQAVYNRFTEGLDTTDLITAKHLLNELYDCPRG